jgi:histidine triad (HIT) family protein
VLREIPCKEVYSDSKTIAFYDIQPQAPVHVLVIPKKHYTSLLDVPLEETSIFQSLFESAQKVAGKLLLTEAGFRTVFNTGPHGCQSVFHLHLHLLGGSQLGGSMVG